MRMRNDTRLKQLLNKYNVTQQSFADMLCVTKYTAWKIINNKRPLRSDEIVKICRKFDVSANWLLGLNELSNPYDRDIDKLVNELPSVIPKGHWIKEESPFGWDGHSYQCSECGRSVHLDTIMEDLEDYPYCHCGAYMRELEE